MAALLDNISSWFDEGVKKGSTHLVVVCDTFDYEEYPIYVLPGQDARKVFDAYNGKDMQRVMEVYNLSINKSAQLGKCRVMNF